ncbi:hypothetical protein CONLIGDRAFT_641337 [Coniochaeta ligniaria NRRL 30616]|uniref:Uncharacterized protein n=1 Tax=Coniochaeta ligniaria NRRL 30616 TaxID=1408157 RepID=A0A1J7IV27_9PEZI|nr:hypothetical protein CONLIGDRAFT_641337 [Coniochaeta ligniaria NRRL 30616]
MVRFRHSYASAIKAGKQDGMRKGHMVVDIRGLNLVTTCRPTGSQSSNLPHLPHLGNLPNTHIAVKILTSPFSPSDLSQTSSTELLNQTRHHVKSLWFSLSLSGRMRPAQGRRWSGGNYPGGNYPGGNYPGGNYLPYTNNGFPSQLGWSGGNYHGGNYHGGNHHGGNYLPYANNGITLGLRRYPIYGNNAFSTHPDYHSGSYSLGSYPTYVNNGYHTHPGMNGIDSFASVVLVGILAGRFFLSTTQMRAHQNQLAVQAFDVVMLPCAGVKDAKRALMIVLPEDGEHCNVKPPVIKKPAEINDDLIQSLVDTLKRIVEQSGAEDVELGEFIARSCEDAFKKPLTAMEAGSLVQEDVDFATLQLLADSSKPLLVWPDEDFSRYMERLQHRHGKTRPKLSAGRAASMFLPPQAYNTCSSFLLTPTGSHDLY